MDQKYGMGYLPDLPSIKDYTPDTQKVASLIAQTSASKTVAKTKATSTATTAKAAAAAPALVPSVDLRAFCSPIEDQKTIGSCTANSAAGIMEYFERRAYGKHIDASRLFIYKTSRNLLGWTGDTGAYLRTAMEALVCFGAPPERYWPYDVTKYDVEPSAFCYAFGDEFEATQYYRLDPNGVAPTQVLTNVKTYLAAGFPSMFGFPVYDEYMHIPADAKAAYPASSSHLYGGHANVAVGYDDNLQIGPDKGALLVRNSWGTNWGLGGYAWLSYKYVTAGLANDFWTMISQRWVDTGKF